MKLKYSEYGEANKYHLDYADRGGKWFAVVQLNGELTPYEQKEIMQKVAISQEIYDLVYAMRTFQQLYFRTRDKNVMARAIEMEKRVDALLESVE